MSEQLSEILAPYKGHRELLIPALQKVQGAIGYINEDAIAEVAKQLDVSQSEIWGAATFYAQFRFSRPGEHSIRVCMGTACYVRGGDKILEEVERTLDVQPGGTTKDYKFNLERVACFGSCALAPVMVVDDDVYGRMTVSRVKKILAEYGYEKTSGESVVS